VIGRSLLIIGALLLVAWGLWSRWGPTRGDDLIGRRLFAAALVALFLGAVVRLAAHA
jgi:hypothetical protein